MALSTSYFTDRLDTNGARMKGLNSELVTYKRGTTEIPNISATLILADEAEEIFPGVVQTRIERQDFVVDTAQLASNGLATPKTGDNIIRNNGDLYRLVSMPGDNPPYRFFTSSRKRMRLHAELIRSGT